MSNFGEIGATVIELFYVFWGHAGPPSIALSASRDKKNTLVLREIRTRGPLDYKSSALTIEPKLSLVTDMELYMHSSIAFQPSFGLSSIWAQSDPDPACPTSSLAFTGPLPEGAMENGSQTAKKRQKVLFLAIFTDGDSSESRPSRKSGPQKCRISERQKVLFLAIFTDEAIVWPKVARRVKVD